MDRYDALILTGGESTTMYELARTYDLFEPLQKPIADGIDINVDDIPEPHRLAEHGW